MYEVMMKINGDDIYNRLPPQEKILFDTVVITDVERRGDNSVVVHGVGIDKYHNNKLYKNIKCE